MLVSLAINEACRVGLIWKKESAYLSPYILVAFAAAKFEYFGVIAHKGDSL